MKVKISSNFLNATDLDGGKGTVTILAVKEGDAYKGKTGYLESGKVLVAKVKLASGVEKVATLNKNSAKYLIEKYGDEVEAWVGKEVEVISVNQMVSNEMKTVLYFGAVPGNKPASGTPSEGEDEINIEDIPF